MTYSDFTLSTVRKKLGLRTEQRRLFGTVAPVEVPQWLRESLDAGMPMAVVSEKARSEFIVAPLLLTLRKMTDDMLYIYSGQRLDVDLSQGLVGECDFILATTPPVLMMQSPIITIVEAKKHDIESGLGQCAAQMVGARLFNQQEGNDIETIFGCVTTGEIWQFLKLEDKSISIDTDRYFIDNVGLILGILQVIVAVYDVQKPQ